MNKKNQQSFVLKENKDILNTSNSVTTSQIQQEMKFQSNRIASIRPVRSSIKNSIKSLKKVKKSGPIKPKKNNMEIFSKKTNATSIENKEESYDILQSKDTSAHEMLSAQYPDFRPESKTLLSCLTPKDKTMFESVRTQSQPGTKSNSRSQSQTYYVDDDRDSNTFNEADHTGSIDQMCQGIIEDVQQIDDLLMKCDMQNPQLQQFSNYLNDSSHIDMDGQLHTLLDSSHMTYQTINTNLGPRYIGNMDAFISDPNASEFSSNRLGSPIQKEVVRSRKHLTSKSTDILRSRNLYSKSPVVLRDCKAQNNRLERILASKSRNDETIGSTGVITQMHSFNQLPREASIIFVDVSQSPVSQGRSQSVILPEKKMNIYSFPKKSRGLLKVQSEITEVKDLKKKIKTFKRKQRKQPSRESKFSENYKEKITDSSVEEPRCISNECYGSSLPLQCIELSIPMPQVRRVFKDNQPEQTKSSSLKIALMKDSRETRIFEDTAPSIYCDDFKIPLRSNGSLNEDINFPLKREKISTNSNRFASETGLSRSQQERIDKVQERILYQHQKLQEQELKIQKQQQQFNKIIQTKKSSLVDHRDQIMSPMSLNDSQLLSKKGLNMTLNQVKPRLSIGSRHNFTLGKGITHHTKNNSMQTAQFVAEEAAEYYFSGARSLKNDIMEESNVEYIEPEIHSRNIHSVMTNINAIRDFNSYKQFQQKKSNLPLSYGSVQIERKGGESNLSQKQKRVPALSTKKSSIKTIDQRSCDLGFASRQSGSTIVHSRKTSSGLNHLREPHFTSVKSKLRKTNLKKSKSKKKQKKLSLSSIGQRGINVQLFEQLGSKTKWKKSNEKLKKKEQRGAKFLSRTTAQMTQDSEMNQMDETLEIGRTDPTFQTRDISSIMLQSSPGIHQYQFQEMNDAQLIDFQSEFLDFEQNFTKLDKQKSQLTVLNEETNERSLDTQQNEDLNLNFDRHIRMKNPSDGRESAQSNMRRKSPLDNHKAIVKAKSIMRPGSVTHMRSKPIQFDQGRSTSKANNRSTQSFVPMKSSIIMSKIDHKNRVQSLKNQFQFQKLKEKEILANHIQLQKAAIARLQREAYLIKVENQKTVDETALIEKKHWLKTSKGKEIGSKISTIQKQVFGHHSEFQDVRSFGSHLKNELEGEMQMIQDIQFITQKYKKLLAEQKRDKEKLVSQVMNQRKIINNLANRKAMMIEDSQKLYDNFNVTIDKDETRNKAQRKPVNRHDKEVISC